MRKIGVFTGSRADRSPLERVIELLGEHCVLIETEGMFGHEQKFLQMECDLLVILGDRYESLVCATVANYLCIPIVHIHGGEITEGAIDDNFRHAISKLSYYHFVAHEAYKRRVVQLGERPDRVFVTGAPGIDGLEKLPTMPNLHGDYVLVCLHPETLGDTKSNYDLANYFAKTKKAIWIKCNNDRGSEYLTNGKSYSRKEYLNLMYYAQELIGNSSSFIFEGRTLKKKIKLIGDRQKGRNEYYFGEPGTVSPKIAELLLTLPIPEKPRKTFYE